MAMSSRTSREQSLTISFISESLLSETDVSGVAEALRQRIRAPAASRAAAKRARVMYLLIIVVCGREE